MYGLIVISQTIIKKNEDGSYVTNGISTVLVGSYPDALAAQNAFDAMIYMPNGSGCFTGAMVVKLS